MRQTGQPCNATICQRWKIASPKIVTTASGKKLYKSPDAIDAPDASPCPAMVLSAGQQLATSRRVRRDQQEVFRHEPERTAPGRQKWAMVPRARQRMGAAIAAPRSRHLGPLGADSGTSRSARFRSSRRLRFSQRRCHRHRRPNSRRSAIGSIVQGLRGHPNVPVSRDRAGMSKQLLDHVYGRARIGKCGRERPAQSMDLERWHTSLIA